MTAKSKLVAISLIACWACRPAAIPRPRRVGWRDRGAGGALAGRRSRQPVTGLVLGAWRRRDRCRDHAAEPLSRRYPAAVIRRLRCGNPAATRRLPAVTVAEILRLRRVTRRLRWRQPWRYGGGYPAVTAAVIPSATARLLR